MPERGDPLHLAELGRSYEGEIELSGLGRLVDSLAGSEGLIRYRLAFDRDHRGRPCVAGHLVGALPLQCQRCLEVFALDVERDWRVVLLAEAAEEALLDEGEDARLISDKGMPLAELIEDELILAVPLVPKHPAGAVCELPAGEAVEDEAPVEEFDEPEDNPFAELSRLKRGN
jgi:uncharacterized protein